MLFPIGSLSRDKNNDDDNDVVSCTFYYSAHGELAYCSRLILGCDTCCHPANEVRKMCDCFLLNLWLSFKSLTIAQLYYRYYGSSFHTLFAGKGKASQDKVDAMLDFINEPVSNTVGDIIKVPPEQDDLADMVRTICRAADGRKAEDIVAMRVSKISTLTSFLVICSGNSRPQNQAIVAAISDSMMEEYEMKTQGNGVVEGSADSGWMLLDYGSVMVHVMTPKSRLFYDVEGQWRKRGGEYMDLGGVILPNTAEEEATLGGTMGGVSQEDDPFWS